MMEMCWVQLTELSLVHLTAEWMAMQTVLMMEMYLDQLTEILKEMSLARLSAEWMAMPTAQMMEMCLVQLMGIRLEQLTDLQKGANWAEN